MVEATTLAAGVPISEGDGSGMILPIGPAGLKSVSTTAALTAPWMVSSPAPASEASGQCVLFLQTAQMANPEDPYGEDGPHARGASMGGEASVSHHASRSSKKGHKREKSGKGSSRKTRKSSGPGPEDVPVPSIEMDARGREETSPKKRTKDNGRVSKPAAKKK